MPTFHCVLSFFFLLYKHAIVCSACVSSSICSHIQGNDETNHLEILKIFSLMHLRSELRMGQVSH